MILGIMFWIMDMAVVAESPNYASSFIQELQEDVDDGLKRTQNANLRDNTLQE